MKPYEPRSEKTGLRGFRPGLTQTGLYSQRKWLEAWNFRFRKKRDCTICLGKTKTLISFAVTTKNVIPPYFLYGNRFDQIMHTRLRTECGSLNYYMYLHWRNLIPSPNCACGAVENNTHFLLRCPRYDEIRVDMINTVTAVTLLHGNLNLSIDANQEIFKAVHKYICQSKWFST